MPDNQIPAAKTEPSEEPAEFNFSSPASEAPRIRRRSLKGKQPGLIKAPASVPTIARELEREAPPLPADQAAVARAAETKETPKAEPAAKPEPAKPAEAIASAPPKTTPAVAPVGASRPATASPSSSTVRPATTASAPPRTTPAASSASTASPHPTRPATLYYSSYPRKEKEASPSSSTTAAPMKTIPTASTPASSSSAGASSSASTTRPATSPAASTIPVAASRPAAAASRPSITTDYRANIERQSREQKSVGSILTYVVYGLIAFFVIAAALAGYGGYTLSKRISDQSVTVSDLDTKYAAANKDLAAKLAATQDTLAQAQAQITRENDLIVKQQDELNRLIATTSDTTKGLATEKQARTQEAANLRARLRDLEYARANATTNTTR